MSVTKDSMDYPSKCMCLYVCSYGNSTALNHCSKRHTCSSFAAATTTTTTTTIIIIITTTTTTTTITATTTTFVVVGNDLGEVDYRTLANQTAAHVLQEAFHVSGVDICDSSTFTNTSGGWRWVW